MSPPGGPTLTPDLLARRLVAVAPSPPAGRAPRAAVATILRWVDERPQVFLIERAVRANDHWSGHVSFPGGREEPGDGDLRVTAVRETREEVGLDLERSARLLGTLAPVRAMARGRLLPMTITPYVFHLRDEAEVVLGEEAVAAFWLPLDDAASGALDSRYEWKIGPVPLPLPCWRHDGHAIWGLTYQMLRNLIG